MPVLVLAGEEEFLISRRIAELKASLLVAPWHTINLIKLSNPNMLTLSEAACTLPFGAGKRIILIQDTNLFTKKRKSNKPSENGDESADKKSSATGEINEEGLASVLETVPENTYLVFVCPYNFDSTLRLSKLISKSAQIEEFPKEKYFPGARSAKLESWCRAEAKKHAATVEDKAIAYLLEGTEADLRELSSEIEKAALTAMPSTVITYDLVANISSAHGHIFQFVDLWLNGQTGEALNNLSELLAQQNAIPVLAAIQTLLGKWIRLKALYEQYGQTGSKISFGEMVKKIAGELKLLPFTVEKDLRRLQKYTAANLIDKRIQLTRLEYAMKVGQIPDQHALALFVLS